MLAEKFDVSAYNLLMVLRQAGVAIRPRRGGPAGRWRAQDDVEMPVRGREPAAGIGRRR
jgi:hypothetical protein